MQESAKKKAKTQSKPAAKAKRTRGKSPKRRQPPQIPPGVGLPEQLHPELECAGCKKLVNETLRRDCWECVYYAVREQEFHASIPAMALRELKRKTGDPLQWFHEKVREEVGERHWPTEEQQQRAKQTTFQYLYDKHTRAWMEARREALEDESLPPMEPMNTPSVEWLERQPDWHPRREKRKRMALIERELEIFRRKNLPEFHPLKLEPDGKKPATNQKKPAGKKQTAKKATTRKKPTTRTPARRKEAAK